MVGDHYGRNNRKIHWWVEVNVMSVVGIMALCDNAQIVGCSRNTDSDGGGRENNAFTI